MSAGVALGLALYVVGGYAIVMALVFVFAVFAACLSDADHDRHARKECALVALQAHVWPKLAVRLVRHMVRTFVGWAKW